MTILTLYGSTTADSTLTSACDMATSSGGTETTVSCDWGGSGTTYGELYASGGTSLPSSNSIPATPSGHGWIFYVGAGNFALGNWQATFAHAALDATIPIDFTLRFFKYSGGTYTPIGSIAISPGNGSLSRTVYTFPATAMPSVSFDTPDYLYVDLWEYDATGIAFQDTGILYLSSSAVAGVTDDLQVTTADFAAGAGSGIIDPTIFGSAVADATLTTACVVAGTTGGVETSKNTVFNSGSGNFGEIWSQGSAGTAAVAAIPAAPTGHGWVYRPGAGTFIAGNWSASITATPANNTGTWNFRVFSHIGSVYALVGTLTVAISATVKTTFTFANVAFPAVTLGATDYIYFDLWYQDTTGVNPETVTIFEATTAVAGVAGDMQINTANWLPASINSTWIPRVLGGTLIRSWVPRVLGGTLIQYVGIPATGLALAGESDGTSSLSGTFSLATSLIAECDGVGTLAAPLSATLALPATTLAGVGTLAGTTSLTTALSDSLAGSGTLTGTLSTTAAVALAVTLAGSSTEVATLSMQTALTSSLGGIGTLTPTLTESVALSLALGGVGTLTGALSGGGALAVTMTGNGTLTGSLSAALALGSTTFTGVGTLTPTLSATFILPGVTFTGVGILTGGAIQLSVALQLSANGTSQLSVTLSASTALPTTTLTGNSTLAGTIQLSTLLSSTIPGVGTFTPTIRASFTLSGATMAGVGMLTGAAVQLSTSLADTLAGNGVLTAAQPTLKTSLADTIAGIGQLVGALSGGGALAVTMASISSTVGAFSLSTALVGSTAGNGTLAGTFKASMALTGTSGGTGSIVGTLSYLAASQATLAGTSTLSGISVRTTYLLVTLPGTSGMAGTSSRVTLLACMYIGTGSLSPILTLGTLACLFTGISQCTGAISFPGPSATATWKTRDLKATWVTRDLKATWKTRDLETTWKTRR